MLTQAGVHQGTVNVHVHFLVNVTKVCNRSNLASLSRITTPTPPKVAGSSRTRTTPSLPSLCLCRYYTASPGRAQARLLREDLPLSATTAAARSHFSGSTLLLFSPSSDDTEESCTSYSTLAGQRDYRLYFTAELAVTRETNPFT